MPGSSRHQSLSGIENSFGELNFYRKVNLKITLEKFILVAKFPKQGRLGFIEALSTSWWQHMSQTQPMDTIHGFVAIFPFQLLYQKIYFVAKVPIRKSFL